MRRAIYSGPNRSGVCICGHKWDDHHLGGVIRQDAMETDGDVERSDEMGGLDEEGNPHCSRYRDTLDTAARTPKKTGRDQ